MSTFAISAVHLDDSGQITHARLLRPDSETQSWLPHSELEAHEVANHIAVGDEIYSLFLVPNVILGPKFRLVVYAGGAEGVELEADVVDRRARDLIQF